jgi:hypothetical protein
MTGNRRTFRPLLLNAYSAHRTILCRTIYGAHTFVSRLDILGRAGNWSIALIVMLTNLCPNVSKAIEPVSGQTVRASYVQALG